MKAYTGNADPTCDGAKLAGTHTVWTIGQVEIQPNARSIISGYVRANLQFRAPGQTIVEPLKTRDFKLAKTMNKEIPHAPGKAPLFVLD